MRGLLYFALPVLLVTVETSKVLLLPVASGFNSRLMNMAKIGRIITEAGHDVTILVNTKTAEYVAGDILKKIVYEVPADIKVIQDFAPKSEALSFRTIMKFVNDWTVIDLEFCSNLLAHRELLDGLKEQEFDLVIADNMDSCSRITVAYLDAPMLLYSNMGVMQFDLFYPQITSFTCINAGVTCSTPEMSFGERTLNLMYNGLLNYIVLPQHYNKYNELKENHGIDTPHVSTTFSRALILSNSDSVLDYPRPLMPHLFHISGLYHKKASPLEGDWASFVESSAPHGVVVLSFGTLIAEMSKERAEMLAKVFGRLPQKVIWRFKGPRPDSLANNTRLTEWFPQNDIIAHPLTKVFITHCGVSSTYEAAFNGVPVVALPLFVDQHSHAGKLVLRAKMGVQLDFKTMNEKEFEEALKEVLTNPVYKENAKQISERLVDRPVEPKDLLLYVVEHAIRTKGAQYLISEAALGLSAFQFYSLDVICFLVVVVCAVIGVMSYGLVMLCKYCVIGKTKLE